MKQNWHRKKTVLNVSKAFSELVIVITGLMPVFRFFISVCIRRCFSLTYEIFGKKDRSQERQL